MPPSPSVSRTLSFCVIHNKHPPRAFFATVAYDLAARKITSARQMGIENGSNGGLPVGNMLVCQVTYWKW